MTLFGMEEEVERDVLDKLHKWLGKDGIGFFQEVKAMHGQVDAVWVEGGVEDDPSKTSFANAVDRAQHSGIPHAVHFREGMQVRNFLRGIFGVEWTDADYDNRWAALVDKVISNAPLVNTAKASDPIYDSRNQDWD